MLTAHARGWQGTADTFAHVTTSCQLASLQLAFQRRRENPRLPRGPAHCHLMIVTAETTGTAKLLKCAASCISILGGRVDDSQMLATFARRNAAAGIKELSNWCEFHVTPKRMRAQRCRALSALRPQADPRQYSQRTRMSPTRRQHFRQQAANEFLK